MDRRASAQDGNGVTMKRFSDYSKWIMVMINGIVVTYYPVRGDIIKYAIRPYFLVCQIFICSTFLADLSLMLLTSYLLRFGRISERLYIAAKILIHTTGVLMMLTSVTLLLLRNPSYALVTFPVLPVMAIVSIVFYNGINTGQAREVTDYDEDQRSELKQFFDLSTLVTVAALGGMVATIFGYFKNFPKDVDQVKYSEAFIFFTVVFGLLAMLLTTLPPSLPHPNARSRYITFIKVLKYSLFGLLVLIVLAVAAEFLGQVIFLAFLPIFFAVVVWFRKEFILQGDGTSHFHSATGHESEPDTSSITITTFIFAALMAVYSVNFGSEGDDLHVKTCMFFLSLAFMSSLSWMAYRSPRTPSLAKAVTVLTYSTIVWSVFAVLGLIFLAIRSGDGKRE